MPGTDHPRSLRPDRREVLQGLIALLALPGVPASAATQPPRQLDPALLSALVDTMLPQTTTPGGLAAGTPRAVQDLMASWASPQTHAAFTALLASLDDAARRTAGHAFVELDASTRLDVLTRFHAAHSGEPAYARFYRLVTTLFFLSEIGATQVLGYEHVPGAWRASLPLTADTIASAV